MKSYLQETTCVNGFCQSRLLSRSPVPEGSSVAMQNGVLLVTLIHREWWGIYETTIAQAVMPLHSVARPILGKVLCVSVHVCGCVRVYVWYSYENP